MLSKPFCKSPASPVIQKSEGGLWREEFWVNWIGGISGTVAMIEGLKKQLALFPRVDRVLRRAWQVKRYLLRRMEGERILRRNYRKIHGRPLDMVKPETFSEKLFWWMIKQNRKEDPRFTEMADKFLVRDYVARKVGGQYLAELFWQGTEPRLIPFDRLPQQYALKTNHGSGQVIVVKGDVDRNETIAKLEDWLQSNYYWREREYQYLNIKPRVMAEEFLDDGLADGPLDYRFWCFHGVPTVIQVDNHAHDINPFFDPTWKLLDLVYRPRASCPQIERPGNLEEMLVIATALAEEFAFVRVDLYNIKGRIVFGELTFTPVAGNLRFHPEEWDRHLGERWMVK